MNINNYPTLRARLAIVLVSLTVLFAAGVASIIYIDFRNELRSNLRHRLENITTLASLQQNGDELLKVQSQGDEFFNLIQDRNARIKRSDPELIFVYTMRKDEQGIFFVVDARISSDEPDISNFGDRYEEPSDTLWENFDTMTGTIVEPEIYTDEFGSFLSGYAPIYDSNRQRAGVLGVDISADTIVAQERRYLLRLVLILLLSLPVMVVSSVIFANYLAKPIVNLRDMANEISTGNLDTRIVNIPRTREIAELAIDLNAMTKSLGSLINDLEQRVKERTQGLTKKTDQLRAASYVARKAADIQDLSILLETVVKLVADQFNFYHAGIFLVNETGDEIVLMASSSEGGKRMIEKGYSLKTGAQGVVESAASQKKSRITPDPGTDPVFFNIPDLPATRSEIALPLMIRSKVLGVLDIHSDQPMAFNVDDIDVLQTLADQVAVVLANTRLSDEIQTALMQVEALTAARTREAWKQQAHGGLAYTYTPLGLRAGKASEIPESHVKIPITLRGQKIGSISVVSKDNTPLGEVDKEMIGEVAYQTGLALDNVRLVEEAQQRAKQEQTVGELATRFSQSMDIDVLLQTAARELGQIANVAEVSVYIGELPEQTPQKRRQKRSSG